MKEVSDYIFTFFQSVTAFTDVVSDRLYPVAANPETSYPFTVYTINQQQGYTKDMSQFQVTLSCYFKENEYTRCVEFADAITATIKDEKDLDWQGNAVGFIEENQSFVANITFNIEK